MAVIENLNSIQALIAALHDLNASIDAGGFSVTILADLATIDTVVDAILVDTAATELDVAAIHVHVQTLIDDLAAVHVHAQSLLDNVADLHTDVGTNISDTAAVHVHAQTIIDDVAAVHVHAGLIQAMTDKLLPAAVGKVTPTAAAAKRATSSATNLTLGSAVEVLTDTGAATMVVTAVNFEALEAAGTYEFSLWTGASADTCIGTCRVTGGIAGVALGVPLKTSVIPINSKLSAKVMNNLTSAKYVDFSLVYQTY